MTTSDDLSADPGLHIERATERTLELARTWMTWDGRPRLAADGERVYTPHKVIRRYADHLIDHLAQVEALLAGVPTQPNEWHQSAVTTEADFARFTEVDLVEAEQRLTRLSRTFRLLLLAAGPAEWDTVRGGEGSLRDIAEHVGSSWYAEQLGDLTMSSSQ